VLRPSRRTELKGREKPVPLFDTMKGEGQQKYKLPRRFQDRKEQAKATLMMDQLSSKQNGSENQNTGKTTLTVFPAAQWED
jgi:hypothetical protein